MPITIELPPVESQHARNEARWAEILEDRSLAQFPGRVETDRHGTVLMSPPPNPDHGSLQGEIAHVLRSLLPRGRVITECPISTADGVKAADVAWISAQRFASMRGRPCLTLAPEICVEVVSPSNSAREWDEKRALFFDAGAQEVWLCLASGEMEFHIGPVIEPQSRLCPNFPRAIQLD